VFAFPATPAIHNTVVDALHCKLPVSMLGQQGSGGFITFPAGTVTADPSSNVTAPGSELNPGGPGDWFALSYDNAAKRWLPVPTTWVTPDGQVYFFTMDPSRHGANSDANSLVEVNAQTGAPAVLGIPPLGYGWQVIAVTADYVYAMSGSSHPGLYVMPLSAPYTQELYVTDGFWDSGSGDFAFGSSIPGGGAIVRIDARKQVMGNGAVGPEPWFDKSGSAQVLGFDVAGDPVIWTGTDWWIASAPGQATKISSTAPLTLATPMVSGANAPVADANGLWFSTIDGIYLYAGGQTTRVSNLAAQVAGPCV
jgi:hypothetical protein